MSAALPVLMTSVTQDFVDYNHHMNDAAYALVFSRSVDAFFARAGLDAAGRDRTGQTIYTLAMLIRYEREVRLGAPLAVAARLLEHDAKRVRLWLEMTQSETGNILATCEQVVLCVRQSGETAAATRFAPDIAAWLQSCADAQAGQPWPDKAGSGISLRR